mmetsp:Transcript_14653/g.16835  ORF Transcript_14653/g.16835 Transcript_14653/m.16835 type:complete len:156 (-) Transcript_14653:240-707(-)
MHKVDPYVVLTENEIDNSSKVFAEFDTNESGAIDKEELKSALEKMGQNLTDEEVIRMIDEIDESNTGEIQFKDFLKIIAYHKDLQKSNDEDDTLMAFLAMGGGPGKEGKVDAKVLIQVIKEEFNMTIDIEKLIEEIDADGSGEIEYEEFKNLLSN